MRAVHDSGGVDCLPTKPLWGADYRHVCKMPVKLSDNAPTFRHLERCSEHLQLREIGLPQMGTDDLLWALGNRISANIDGKDPYSGHTLRHLVMDWQRST